MSFTTIHETSNYSLARDRFGHYEIHRLADNASVYLQGDDALSIEDEFAIDDAVISHSPYLTL